MEQQTDKRVKVIERTQRAQLILMILVVVIQALLVFKFFTLLK
jgi:hypothetical protein